MLTKSFQREHNRFVFLKKRFNSESVVRGVPRLHGNWNGSEWRVSFPPPPIITRPLHWTPSDISVAPYNMSYGGVVEVLYVFFLFFFFSLKPEIADLQTFCWSGRLINRTLSLNNIPLCSRTRFCILFIQKRFYLPSNSIAYIKHSFPATLWSYCVYSSAQPPFLPIRVLPQIFTSCLYKHVTFVVYPPN